MAKSKSVVRIWRLPNEKVWQIKSNSLREASLRHRLYRWAGQKDGVRDDTLQVLCAGFKYISVRKQQCFVALASRTWLIHILQADIDSAASLLGTPVQMLSNANI